MFAPRLLSGIENGTRAFAGARFSLRLSRAFLSKIALELSMARLASFWVVLRALLASFRVLLVAPRCLLGLSWLPLDALEALFATDSAVRGAQKRRPNNIRNSNVEFSQMLLLS